MRQVGGDQLVELGDELVNPFRRNVEPEDLDRNGPVVVGMNSAIDRTERAGANLMEDTERPEGVRRRRTGSVGVQCGYSSGRLADRSIEPPRLQLVRPGNSWLHLARRTPSLRQ
jgi:hypothetical protein